MEPQFIAAAARRMGPAGFASQPDAITALFGPDALPEPIRRRRTKATFDLVFFTGRSRAFVERWDGSGVAGEIVDPVALRREWQRHPRPDARSYPLIKAAWLAEQCLPSPAASRTR